MTEPCPRMRKHRFFVGGAGHFARGCKCAMQLTVFGNNATCPQALGACSCFLVQAGGKRILLDMGCASLTQLQRWVDLKQLDLIVISHLHFDHFGDLFCAKYQLETRAALGEQIPVLPLCSPALPPWARRELLEGGVFRHTVMQDGQSLRLDGAALTFYRVPHLVESYAVRLCAEGKTLAYSGDSAACDALVQAARGADCFLCEASLVQGQQQQAGHHLMAGDAGRLAAQAGAKRLLLTHYHPGRRQAVLEQARAAFAAAQLTQIGERYEI